MSTDTTELEIDFYLGAPASVTELETLEISHPSFSQTFYLTFSDADGFYANDENGIKRFFQYLPMSLKGSTLTTDLDYGVGVTLGDLGDLIHKELDRVEVAETWNIHPKVIHRTYRSDRLDVPMRGAIELEIGDYTYNQEGFSFEARAPDVKSPGTGILYTLERFSIMLAFFYS